MKEIILRSMKLQNFKCFHSKEITFTPRTEIRGDNGVGKTTIYDAVLWVLFGQDSSGRKDFSPRPIAGGGDTMAEVVLEVGGEPLSLRKVMREKWTRKRGQATEEFTGYEYDHYVDDIPVKKGDYEKKISELCDFKTFQLLTDVYAFARLHWREKRQIITKLLKDIDLHQAFEDHPELLGRDLIMLKEQLKNIQKETNRELQGIPYRIDELAKTEKPARSLKSLEIEKKKIEAELQGYTSDEPILTRLELQRSKENTLQNTLKRLQIELDRIQKDIDAKSKDIESLRKQLREEKSQAIVVGTTCPTCNQTLPPEMVEEVRVKEEAKKQEKISEIVKMGKRAKDELIELQARGQELVNEISRTKQELQETQETIQELEKKLSLLNINRAAPLREQLEQIEREIAKYHAYQDTQKRIEDLKVKEKQLAETYEDCTKKIIAIEQVEAKMAQIVEENISSQFRFVKFKLFERQINGALVDTCEITKDGVPYQNLSHSEQIKAGLDIIRTLQDMYDLRVFVFVDNAEAITEIPEMPCQTIKLVVDDKAKNLIVNP
jgi:DNA repair exonuclease SbcCD ATPase subunit